MQETKTSPTQPLVLGIESSCDDTACAVLDGDGRVLSSVVSSQLAAHRPYGGVVPEIASREHLRNWGAVRTAALSEAEVDLESIDVVAATRGPGLVGSLLVGLSVGKALAFGAGKPFFGVHHLEGHLYSPFLDPAGAPAQDVPKRFVGLVVSGGHTAIYSVNPKQSDAAADAFSIGGDQVRTVCETRDDAMGECFDKVGKRLGLPFPGGPLLDRLAERLPSVEADRGRAHLAAHPGREVERTLFFKTPRCGEALDFSYSGLKTQSLVEIDRLEREGLALDPRSLLALAEEEGELPRSAPQYEAVQLMAAFRHAAVRQVIDRLQRYRRQQPFEDLAVSGGVAANRALRRALQAWGEREHVHVHLVPLRFCGDNAAMIAYAALRRFQAGSPGDPLSVDAISRLPVGGS